MASTNSCCANDKRLVAHDSSIYVDSKNTTLDKVLQGIENGTEEEIQSLTNNVEGLNIDIINIDNRVTNLENSSISITIDDEISNVSKNPVQNKVIHNALEEKVDDDDYLTYWNVNKIIFDVFGF